MNYKLKISYCGTNFHGWAKQPNMRTVEGEITNALFSIFKLNDVAINASGRTDVYVHALDQTINIRHDSLNIEPTALMNALNSKLGNDVRINQVTIADDKFHARYHCIEKTYLYLINTKPHFDVFNRNNIYQLNKALDVNKLKLIAQYFIGNHDFLSFSTSELNNTTRTIKEIEINQENGLVMIKITGNGFLRSMVRMIVAFMINFACDKNTINDLQTLLKNPKKGSSGSKVPGCGLYLYKTTYK